MSKNLPANKACERYQNLSKDEKQRPIEYRKRCFRMRENALQLFKLYLQLLL